MKCKHEKMKRKYSSHRKSLIPDFIVWSKLHEETNSFQKKGDIANHRFSSVAQLCLTLWDLMGCSTPGFPVHHQSPELTQTHVH